MCRLLAAIQSHTYWKEIIHTWEENPENKQWEGRILIIYLGVHKIAAFSYIQDTDT